MEEELYVVGKRVPRTDSIYKVTGAAEYTADIKLPNMLIAKVLRSPYPHAKIVNIDISKAKRVPGVKAVITGKDGYGVKWGVFKYTQDHMMLPIDKVRYVGEDIAACAAIDEETAQEAIELIKVDYEPLEPVFDPEEAMKDGAPLIHEGYPRNINIHVHIEVGDVDKAFKEAHYVREDKFRAQGEAYAMLEPYACVAYYKNGYLDLWMPNAGPHVRAKALSNLLKIPLNRIRVRHVFIGGAFGGRSEVAPADFIVSLLSIKTERPVKLVMSREENAISSRQVHDVVARIKTGVKKDGTIVARDYEVIYDGGAYSSTGPIAASVPFYVYEECYRMANVRYHGYRVYTNKGIRGMYGCHGRAFLAGCEAQLDLIAKELGLDPIEIRLKNGLRAGEETATGSKIISCGLQETIEEATKKVDFKNKWKKATRLKGVGMGCVAIMCGFPMGFRSGSSCSVKFNDDGQATIITAIVDNGQGNESMAIQIASEVLGIPMEDINIINADTEATSLDPGAYSQAATFVGANAVKRACEDARRQIAEIAREKLSCEIKDIVIKERMVFSRKNPENKIPISWIVREAFLRGKPIIGVGSYFPNIDLKREWVSKPFGQMAGSFSYGTSVAELTVDENTGKIKVHKFIAAHDCGRPINPMAVEGQLEGGIMQAGIAAIMEGNIWHNGFLMNPDLLEYKIPTAKDMPDIETVLVTTMDPEGPFGAKEGGLTIRMSAYSAIASAFYNATGRLFKELPLTPDKVLELLQTEEG
ncbi:MAG: xanthine dehydrogenase family protein molybdopterin-binding subunit [Deltaproteobacteria bacterium]|nr:xanthine dehydrogenase family protein molybdopterin-binding subunit [Deltaproteobacteria bacterium]